MAAQNPVVVDIFHYGIPQHQRCSGEVSDLLARGTILGRMLDFGRTETDHCDDKDPFLWT